MNSKLIIIVLVIVAVLGGAYLLLNKSYTTPTSMPTSTTMATMPTQTETNGPAVATTSVNIKNFSFDPSSITVKMGDKVTWTNNDSVPHTATADDGSFDTGAIQPGGTASVTFSKPGKVTYHCTFHPNIVGSVLVK